MASLSPVLKRIDLDGKPVSYDVAWFNAHPVWGEIKRCLLTRDAPPIFGKNARGDGLDLSGAKGDVMVRMPKFYVKVETEGDVIRWWISPFPHEGFEIHPMFLQRGGAPSDVYVSAYKAGLNVTSDGILKLYSGTGVRPYVGNDVVEFDFVNGSREFKLGETVTGKKSGMAGVVQGYFVGEGGWRQLNASGKVYLCKCSTKVGFKNGVAPFTVGSLATGRLSRASGVIGGVVVESGAWKNGDAAGHLVLCGGNDQCFNASDVENLLDDGSPPGAAKVATRGTVIADFNNREEILGSDGRECCVVASEKGRIITSDQNVMREKAGNIGPGCGLMNIWTHRGIKLLFFIEYSTLDSQHALGKGIVEFKSLYAFRHAQALPSGANNADKNIGENGSGMGEGENGKTPVVYRGMENLWGNVYEWVDGIEALDTEYRIIRPDGLGKFRNPMLPGDCKASKAVPIKGDAVKRYARGHASAIETKEEFLRLLFIPSQIKGSATFGMCDCLTGHFANSVGNMAVSGDWTFCANSGINFQIMSIPYLHDNFNVGCRFEILLDRKNPMPQ
ncbi:MAG: hypothetical protein PHV34_24510 [Verrucomicrobiae bacterium]|nr:hypothetical protein [Verrucomicrobiae bacterium]